MIESGQSHLGNEENLGKPKNKTKMKPFKPQQRSQIALTRGLVQIFS